MRDEREYHDEFYAAAGQRLMKSPLMRRMQRRMVGHAVRAAGLGPQSNVLSLGCGEGGKERLLAPQVGHVLGVDVSAVAVEQAQQQATQAGLGNLRFAVVDVSADDAGLPAGPFDAVMAFSLLHHLDDAAILRVLRAACGRLQPGGAFHAVDPNVHRFVGLFTGLFRRAYDRCHSPDERELDPRRMGSLFAEAGYVEVRVDYVDFFAHPFAWLWPGCPGGLAAVLDGVDQALVHVPGLRCLGDAFSVTGRRPV